MSVLRFLITDPLVCDIIYFSDKSFTKRTLISSRILISCGDDKTEFMLIGTKQQLSKVNTDNLTVGSIDVAPVTVARNLGTWFASNLNLQEQILKTCKSGFSIYIIFRVISESICHRNLHALWFTRSYYWSY